MSSTAHPVDKLSPEEKRALLSKLLQRRAGQPKSAPLSFGQERLWFLNQLELGNPIYNESGGFRLTGPLNLAAAKKISNEIGRRHEVLRTTFGTVDGRPIQIIAPTPTLTVDVRDLSELPEREQEVQIVRLAKEEASQPFDLARGPLMRIALLRLGAEDHVLLLTLHHIICDGWSMGVLLQEVVALYAAFSNGRPSPLPELPIQYADFAIWQRQWLQGAVLEAQLAYWKQRLAGPLPTLELPTDHRRPVVQTFRGASHKFSLPKPLVESIKALSHQEGVTLFMTLLAAFKILLYRYTGQEDVIVGSPVAGRDRVETKRLIGFFVNTLVLRTDLRGDPTFRELLGRVRESAMSAYAHQELPFEKLVEELHPQRSLSHAPLFQVMFALQSYRMPPLRYPGLRLLPLELDSQSARLDLTLFMADREEGLIGQFEYNTDLFEADRIQRMGGHFQTLLKGIVADPGQRISTLPLLTESERHQLVLEWNDTERVWVNGSAGQRVNGCIDSLTHEPIDRSWTPTLPLLFETQVERSPDGVAVIFEDEQVTYRELNRRSNRLAHHLQNLGIGPEVLVGICMNRSLEMVVGILGILKAGGAYLPLDPEYPRERLAFMLEDAQARVLLTEKKLNAGLPSHLARVVCLDAPNETSAMRYGLSEENPSSGVTPDNLAYVIYTSGSTGKPKGAMNTHRGICNRLLWMQEAYQLTETDRVLQKTPFSFDVSVWEFFWPLVTGARLVVAQPRGHQDSTYLVKLIAEQEISTVHFVPPMLQVFLEARELEACDALRRVICSGEALPLALQERFFARMKAELHNLYGPTEAAVDVTFWACQRECNKSSVPIGRPIANTQIHILDANLQPAPIGVPGELHIGGIGLARGYLNRPELTAAKFIPNPFSQEPGARLYKTGDRACYLPDRNIEFLGRVDHQVKIRGFRIEPEEIEAALEQHPAVRETVVIMREEASDDQRLVAYVVLSQEIPLAIADLRSFLAQKLPEYMVPSSIVILDALPLTPNGKLDRQALPAPDKTRLELEGASVVPRTPTEEMLAGIWAQVLGLEHVGVHDNFFELGGHSLLATQVISRVREAFQVETPLRRLFEEPTVAGLAESIELARQAGPGLQASPLRPVPRNGSLPLSFAQQRLWFMDQLTQGSPVYGIPAGLRLRGRLNVAALEQSLNEAVRRHEVLRTTFAAVGGQPTQVISPNVSLPLPVVDLRELPETERQAEALRLASEEARRPFDLTQGPLLRVTLVRLEDEDHLAAFTMHHIVSDAWSIGVLIRELAALYKSFSNGQPPTLPDLPIQYADFAQWQRQWLQGEVLEAQLAYWKQQLHDAPSKLELPTDRPRPLVPTLKGAVQSLHFPSTLSDALRVLSRRERVTLFMTLVAAFATLLHRYTGQDDLLVGTPIAGRNRAELEGLVGFFVNMLILRADLSGNPTFRELLARIREVALQAYTHQDLPAEKLLEELQPERDPSRPPLVQVAFVFQNAPMPPLELQGLTLTPVMVHSGTAKLDLTLFMWEGAEGLTASFEYSTELFDAQTITRMLADLQSLLMSVVADPVQHLSQLPPFPEQSLSTSEITGTQKGGFDDLYARSNLTKNQLLIWVGQKLQPEAPLYNIATTFTIPARINLEHFQKAFQRLIHSSDALRTVIEETDAVPQQRVIPKVPYAVESFDFSSISDPRSACEAWVHRRCQVPLDFTTRAFDSALIKLSDEMFVWYLNQHHIVSDGWSSGLICRRMSELYESSLQGRLDEKAELPPFQAYLDDQRKHRRSSRYQRDESYWKLKLAEELEPLRLYGRTPLKLTTRVERVAHNMGPEQTRKLKAIAAQEGLYVRTLDASLFNIFAALIATYLYRLSGNRRLSIGASFHNRRSKAFKETIGSFMEVLPLHLTINEDETFLSLIQKVKTEFSETLRHSQYAIGNPYHKKAYDVFLNYHHESASTFHGVPVATEWVHSGSGDEWLTLQVHDFAKTGSLTIGFDLDCDLFSEVQRGRALQHLLQVLDSFLADSTQPLQRIHLLTEEEKERILVKFNQTETAFPETQTVCQLFEEQVRKTPDRVAVVFEDRSLTYSQLNAHANRVAHHLQSMGVGPDVLVALLANRSIDFLTAVLAVFKAGGAYLPLDPSDPSKRLSQVIGQSQISLVLTTNDFLAKVSSALESLPIEERPRVLLIEALLQRDESEENLPSCCAPNNLSYVIYTSGSTGVPKGAMVEHAGMLNHLYAKIIDLQLTDTDIVAQTASQCFDISVWQFLAVLLVGGQVRIVNDEWAHDPSRLLELVDREKVTILETVPSLLQAMLGEIVIHGRPRPDWSALRWLVVTGEALQPDVCRQYSSIFPGIPLLNAYGPTECSDDVTHYPIYQSPAPDVDQMPIGRPVANMRSYVLDYTLSPVPLEVPGELYIGGIGVGRGYLYDASRTAAVFIPDPFSREPGARIYKTGDLVRYRSDGTIEFLGRIDQQVKIRGNRIEPGEIEAALDQHPAVQQSVVLAREDTPGDKRLVGYVVTLPEQTVSVRELRSYLIERLPEYMVPSAFVLLEELPLTPNGKVDRHAIPAPDRFRPDQEKRFEGPRTLTEEGLAAIWSQVLGVEQVGIHDNFFELGGHSLLATQLVFRVQETFQVELPLRRLFEFPSVAGLAQAIEIARQPQNQSLVDQMSPGASLFEAMTIADLHAEAVLDPSICSEALPAGDMIEPSSILLTGATGFLGAFLLHELLEATQADIYCLVRSSNTEEGKRRIQSNLELYSLWDENISKRIFPLPGDLSQPNLGLSEEQFRTLASQLDVIYHNGALVNFMYPYLTHKAPNVFGTQELLRLAGESKLKPVHHVSTISVFQALGRRRGQVFNEQDDLDRTGAPYSGYAQSKWVAEKLVGMARSRGLPVAIYRPGLVSGHSQSGAWNADDFVVSIVRACIELGSVPDVDVMVNLVPVDYVSKAIVHLSRQKDSLGKVFHLVNPQPAHSGQLVNWLRSLGYPLQQISYENWRTTLLNLAEYFQQTDWAPFLHLIKEVETDQVMEPQFECQNTLAGLAGGSIVCPAVDLELLGTYLSCFIRRGILKAPQLQAESGSFFRTLPTTVGSAPAGA